MRVLALLGLVVGLVTTPALAAGGLEGSWSGTWTKNGDDLAVVLTFERKAAGYAGSFDSDRLQIMGIPFGDIRADGSSVHFTLTGDATTTVFDGKMSGDTLTGTFSEGAIKGTFTLTRSPPPRRALTREVTFTNGPVILSGTLLLPPGRNPAVVFLHGSGAEGRWANRYLAEKFAARGIAALIFDKRGVGRSTGDWRTSKFDDLAGDAVAAIRRLQSMPEIDRARVGIYGHSQGGTIAPLVAERAEDVAFVIASAASGLDPAEVEEFSIGNSIGLGQLPQAERAEAQAYVRAIVDVAYRGKDRAPLEAMATRFRDRSWYIELPPADDAYWKISRAIADFRPLEHWREVRAPVLLLYSSRDERVPAALSSNAISDALRASGNRNVSVQLYTGADHTFTSVDPARPGGWPRRAPRYDLAIDWIMGLWSR
jgi:uncharacterized protein